MKISEKFRHSHDTAVEPELTPEVRASIERQIEILNDRIAGLGSTPSIENQQTIDHYRDIIDRQSRRLGLPTTKS